MSVRFQIAALLSLMVNAVLFGIGVILVLSIPELSVNAKYLIPAVVALSLVITPFVSWYIAPRLRNRYWKRQTK
ncbi:hypothetical protein MP213Fo_16760 [Pseudochrobactrum sp. MP213Fo]